MVAPEESTVCVLLAPDLLECDRNDGLNLSAIGVENRFFLAATMPGGGSMSSGCWASSGIELDLADGGPPEVDDDATLSDLVFSLSDEPSPLYAALARSMIDRFLCRASGVGWSSSRPALDTAGGAAALPSSHLAEAGVGSDVFLRCLGEPEGDVGSATSSGVSALDVDPGERGGVDHPSWRVRGLDSVTEKSGRGEGNVRGMSSSGASEPVLLLDPSLLRGVEIVGRGDSTGDGARAGEGSAAGGVSNRSVLCSMSRRRNGGERQMDGHRTSRRLGMPILFSFECRSCERGGRNKVSQTQWELAGKEKRTDCVLQETNDDLEESPAGDGQLREQILDLGLKLRLPFFLRLRRQLLGDLGVRQADKLAPSRTRAGEALHDGVEARRQGNRKDWGGHCGRGNQVRTETLDELR